MVTTDYIYANYYGDEISNPPIYDNAGSIREFLLAAKQNGCAYVLLGGDQTIVPVRYVNKSTWAWDNGVYEEVTETIPTDLYYSDVQGNWDPENWDSNRNTDLFVGRLPFSNSQDIENWTNKLIQYEKDPFPWNPSAVTKVLTSISDEMQDDDNDYDIFSSYFPPSFSKIEEAEVPSGGDPSPTSPSGAQIIDSLNEGYGFYNIYNHGSPNHIAVRTSGYNGKPKYGIFSYDSYTDDGDGYVDETGNGLDNTANNCTIVYSAACTVAEYDSASEVDGVPNDQCMAQAFLCVNGGGPAFLGNTRDGLSPAEANLETYFLQRVYSSEQPIGQAELLSKYDYVDDWNEYSHNLFGDPSMKVWTTAPSNHITAGTWHITTLNNVIPAGVTIYVDPGATIEFDPGANLTVYGTLVANGTASQPITFTSSGSSWGSIIFSGSGANGSSIEYARIENGNEIEVNNTSDVFIKYCSITNSSSYGINVYNSQGFLAWGDTIANSNIYHGIYITDGWDNNCYEDVIYKYPNVSPGYHNGAGIEYNGSDGSVGQNDIRYYNWGVGAIWGSSPSFDWSGRNNRITDCLYGLMVYEQSYCDFGDSLANDCMNSSIDSSVYDNAAVGLYHSSDPCGLHADGNWWGSYPPDASKFYVSSAAYYGTFAEPLSSDPWNGIPLPAGSHMITNAGVKMADATARANGPGTQTRSLLVTADLQDSLLIGIGLKDQNKLDEAKNYFMSFIGRHPDNQAAYVELYGCADSTTTPALIAFFNSHPQGPQIQQILLADLYQTEGQPDLAEQTNNSAISNFPNTPLAVKAEINNMLIDLYDKNDVQDALALLTKVKGQADLTTPMELQDAEAAVSLHAGTATAGSQGSSQKTISTTFTSNTPEAFGLSQNYPNPFNPSTVLRYDIPKAGRVEVTVYDILGRVVETLVDEYEQAGIHSVQFNGERLASGIYFYRLTAPSVMQVKKMLLLK